MSVLNSSIVPASAGGYEIDNSLRFNDDDSAYLSRTPSSAGNRKTWTWSGWVKRGAMTGDHTLFCSRELSTSTPYLFFGFNTSTNIFAINSDSGHFYTTQVFRDPAAWVHIVVAIDTTQATSSNRIKLYINGSQVTDTSTVSYPLLNTDLAVNHTILHQTGAATNGVGTRSQYLDGYLAEVNFVDGQALSPTDFGETGDYGEWKPIKYTGTYGTNGFYLDFKNSASLGNDANGSNNWTPTNLAATDQMLDSPTNNFCTLNPLWYLSQVTLSEGSSKYVKAGTNWNGSLSRSTFGMTSGKRYWEINVVTSVSNIMIGVALESASVNTDYIANDKTWQYYRSGTKFGDGSSNSSYGASYTTGDIIGVALDMDSGAITFYKNGTSQGTAFTSLAGKELFPSIAAAEAGVLVANFGQDSSFAGNKTAQGNADSNSIGDFYYSPPTGFLALCTQNLPDPAVIPSEHFNTVLYTGNGYPTSNTQSVTGVGFQPDWTWIKVRDNPNNHRLFDVVRGVTKDLVSNSTDLESNDSRLTSFDSDGFTTSNNSEVNRQGNAIVSWNWKANGTGVSNTNGSITSTVSANTSAGFSIVSYTGNGTNGATVGHGLSSAPEMVIVKTRSDVEDWGVYHASNTSAPETDRLKLNSTVATADNAGFWNDTAPTNSVFTVGTANTTNWSSKTYISYCFHSVDGYSKVGSYTGNGSTDGPFVYTGFRPAFIMAKKTDAAENWVMIDNARHPVNDVNTPRLLPNSSAAEAEDASIYVDYLSNGFKIRATQNMMNNPGSNYIFIAFAEHPFKYTNAR